MKISEWADKHRHLSPESAAEPGQWRTSRNEPMRQVMDACCDPLTHTVVVMSSAQVGKTETINNIIGYYIDYDPSPMLIVHPTVDMGKAWSKDRLAPMCRDTPRLKGKIKDRKRVGETESTVLQKIFPGGHATITGANSPASLASRPIRNVFGDEVDRYQKSAGQEGDPVDLARKRTTTFWNAKHIWTSTPTIKGESRIEALFEESDQRYWMVPCPDCGMDQRLTWEFVKWPEGRPDEAAYQCRYCGTLWEDARRWKAVRDGYWQPTDEFRGSAGFHLSEIYSPWVPLGKMVRNFLAARRSVETLKTWVNTALGETWESAGERVDPHSLMERLESWPDGAPLGVLVITIGVDVQADRLEIERVGWGTDEESWSLDHLVLRGDPNDPELWRQLRAYIETPTTREDGRQLYPRTTCIDSGGHHTQTVYKFARLNKHKRVFAIKGFEHLPTVWPTGTDAKKLKGKRTQVTPVGVSAAKDALFTMMKLEDPGPGYCHFPKGRPLAWFQQLTAERVETKFVKGFERRFYVLPEGMRNEALDCRVYAYAALQSMALRWSNELRADILAPKPPRPEQTNPTPRDAPSPWVAAQLTAQAQAKSQPSITRPTPRANAVKRASFLGSRSGGWLKPRR